MSKQGRMFWMIVWGVLSTYFIIAAAGSGCVSIGIGSTVCGFMIARNMADYVADEE